MDGSNKLGLIASKMEYMIISHQRRLNITLNSETFKRIGLITDEALFLKEHHIKRKPEDCLSSLKKLIKILSQRKLGQVYIALFENNLYYGNVVLRNLSKTKTVQLQRLQCRAERLIEKYQ